MLGHESLNDLKDCSKTEGQFSWHSAAAPHDTNLMRRILFSIIQPSFARHLTTDTVPVQRQ